MDWHRRYLQQANWTRDLRTYLFKKADLNPKSRVLEVGCGTGAILSEMADGISLHGLDIDSEALAQCRINVPMLSLVRGNALQLPYSNEGFDIVYCHFFLLWVHDPLQALLEMRRVAERGAHILAFAEPDYATRVDQPPELTALGRWQTESLKRQGADPGLGRRLADLFFRAGIDLKETGTLQTAENEASTEDWETEWAVLEADLAGFIPGDDIQKMKEVDRQARARGERKLYVPTHYAWGQA